MFLVAGVFETGALSFGRSEISFFSTKSSESSCLESRASNLHILAPCNAEWLSVIIPCDPCLCSVATACTMKMRVSV